MNNTFSPESQLKSLLGQMAQVDNYENKVVVGNVPFYDDLEPCIVRNSESNIFIHSLQIEPPQQEVVATIKGVPLNHEDMASQEFLALVDEKSVSIRDKAIEWMATYFATILGIEDTKEFSSHNIPREFNVESILGKVSNDLTSSISESMMLDIGVTECNCDISTLLKGNVDPKSNDLMQRILAIAKARAGGNKQ